MKARNILITVTCLSVVGSSFGQPPSFQAILRSVGGPFTTRCDGTGDILGNHTLAFIYWDSNHNGPDPMDGHGDCLAIPGMFCIPEYALAVNFYNFALSDDGSFQSPIFQGWFGLMYPGGPFDLYIRILFGDTEDSCYTSPVFTIAPGPLQEVFLYFEHWTCGPADVDPPPCHPSTAEIYFNMNHSMPQEDCLLQTCPGGRTGLAVRGNQNAHRPPVIQLESGCEIGCEPVNRFSFNPGLWRYLDGLNYWLGNIIGEDVGCLTVRLIDRIPSAQLDTFFAIAQDNEVQLFWQTVREISLDMFELWRPAYSGAHHVADIAAENDSNGASYSFVDTAAFSSGEDYTLVMVDTSGARYAAGYTWLQSVYTPDDGASALPKDFALAQNYPNPFNPETRICFELPRASHVRLTVFNLLGQSVAMLVNGPMQAGQHAVDFDGQHLPSGVYLYRLETGEFTAQRKMVLLK